MGEATFAHIFSLFCYIFYHVEMDSFAVSLANGMNLVKLFNLTKCQLPLKDNGMNNCTYIILIIWL